MITPERSAEISREARVATKKAFAEAEETVKRMDAARKIRVEQRMKELEAKKAREALKKVVNKTRPFSNFIRKWLARSSRSKIPLDS